MEDKTFFETGTDLQLRNDIRLHFCGKRVHSIGHVYGPRINRHYLFILVNSGEAEGFGRKKFRLREQELLVMHPGERLYYRTLTPWSIQWIGISGGTVDEFVKKLGITPEAPVIKIPLYRELTTLLEQFYAAAGQQGISGELEQSALVYQFFAILFRCSDQKEKIDYVSAARSMIDHNFGNALTVEQVADTLHLNPAYLSRLFTKRMGISPKGYLLEKRLENARELLRTTDAPVAEVAFSVGFSDPLYFSRVFSRMTGCSPTAYRAQERP